MNIKTIIKKDLEKSILQSKIPKKYLNNIKISSKSKIAHYQINGIISIAKILNYNTKLLSIKIIYFLKKNIIYKDIQYSHPGFINIFLNNEWLSDKLEYLIYSHRIGLPKEKKKNIIIDYSSPNMAKEMHVGHLRSTILGDTMVRLLEFLGHNVIRVNHIGDWGAQFGMLIAFLNMKYEKNKDINLSLKNLEKFYQKSKKLYDKNQEFKKKSYDCLILLQKKYKKYMKIWNKIIKITMQENNKIYKLLNVTLNNNHITGESFYIQFLPNMILELQDKKIAQEKDGNIIIYLNQMKNKFGKPMGVIIQKKNTTFLYSTIDLACLKYRIQTLNANRIIYYTDIRQKQHFNQIEIIAKKAGYITQDFKLEHHAFGMVLTKENKPFQTRNGKLIKLNTLIKTAINKSKKIIKQKKPYLRKNKVLYLSKIIGISAIKYADLSKNREKNYIFDWDCMLSFHGNTALYIQYTYTRIQSILKKSKFYPLKIYSRILLKKQTEINLAIKILQFPDVIYNIKKNGRPHVLCLYLFQLSSLFSIFYEKYPILYTKTIKIKKSRLKICFLIAKTIKLGLKILGIKTVNFM
ncbi:Arginine--tRNA ligase [Buchnera aphidicola (Takecallis arundicolens)]|uniref:arginine--tRNA ligase n=1 Tax=Buchnera aphidicola TaxID=9 RepID=UPI003463AD38